MWRKVVAKRHPAQSLRCKSLIAMMLFGGPKSVEANLPPHLKVIVFSSDPQICPQRASADSLATPLLHFERIQHEQSSETAEPEGSEGQCHGRRQGRGRIGRDRVARIQPPSSRARRGA
ncbi:hypothetical protein BVI434_410105 [Burkholderia vietnamiensis]|nr:hypothetical protein BVI434_410105 [Burkholderia vietnamiensis]